MARRTAFHRGEQGLGTQSARSCSPSCWRALRRFPDIGAGAEPGRRGQAVPPIGFTTRTLANGLTVYTIRDTRTANVSVQMWYNVGSKDDPAGRSGFAHLFEHILSRVTRNIPHGELSRIVEEQAGGTRNASTGPDMTNYYETVPANQLEAMLWAHAERMGRSVLDQAVFEAERNIVKEEMRQRVLSQPYGRLQRYYTFDTGFVAHPYRRSGHRHDGRSRRRDAGGRARLPREFLPARQCDPDRLRQFRPGPARPLDRPASRQPAAPEPADPAPSGRASRRAREARSMTVYGPNVPLPAVVMTWQRPRLNHPDSAALAVLQPDPLRRPVVAPVPHPRLRAAARDQTATALDFGLEDAGIFAVQAIVASGRDIGEAETALAAEVARLRDQPVSEAELTEARNEIVSQLLFAARDSGRPRLRDRPVRHHRQRSALGRPAARRRAAGDRGGRAARRAPVSRRFDPGLDPLSRSGAAHRRGGARSFRAADRSRARPDLPGRDPAAQPARPGRRARSRRRRRARASRSSRRPSPSGGSPTACASSSRARPTCRSPRPASSSAAASRPIRPGGPASPA